MAQAQAETQVALLATVVLLLDEEAEHVAEQVLRLCLTLDPLARARLRILRVTDAGGRLMAATIVEDQGALQPAIGMLNAPQDRGDPNATRLASSSAGPHLKRGAPQVFEQALNGTLQDALRTTGSDPLNDKGFYLIPNDLAVYLVGRIDSPLLGKVAEATQNVTRAVATHTDARRFALLISAAPLGEQDLAVTPIRLGARSTPIWQSNALHQPWQQLLPWHSHGGEPPLLYTFIFEAWDEAGRYHDRPQLHYALAEALFALFATGMLDHPALKDALDLSTAALDGMGLNRVGSIGTSLVTTPTRGMIDFLAHRLAADVLLSRGLLGQEGGVIAPALEPTLKDQARHDSELWLTKIWQARLYPNHYALPPRLPPRVLAGKLTTWSSLALSTANPDPTGLFWRWQTRGYPLDDEQYWNFIAQNEFETATEVRQWETRADGTFANIEQAIWQDIDQALQDRARQPEGVERAIGFTRTLRDLLVAEQHRLLQDGQELRAQLDQHHRQYEDLVRRAHPADGIPLFPDPPASSEVVRLPRHMEALTHDVTETAFTRVPLPGTLALVGALLAIFGIFAVPVLGQLPFVAHGPEVVRHLFSGSQRAVAGATTLFVIFGLVAIMPFARWRELRRWQRHLAEERTLLHLARAKAYEHAQVLQIIANLILRLNQERDALLGWASQIQLTANGLNETAARLAQEYQASAPLARDIFVVRGQIWEGRNPDELYDQVRQRQPEPALILGFLRHVQTHAGGIDQALRSHTLAHLALEYLYGVLRQDTAELPFAAWNATTAADALDRAIQAARIPMQPHQAGRPLGYFGALVAHPSVAWLPRLTETRSVVFLRGPAPQWCFIARVQTRAPYPLIH